MASRTRLLINIDHVATLRNARKESFPDPVTAAAACERGGAAGIVFHLREDRRHIKDADVARLRESVQGKLDFELSLEDSIVDICCATRPDLATLVPERREEVTTEGGLDVFGQHKRISQATRKLFGAGIAEVALFINPDPEAIRLAADTGANAVELHTGDFARARTPVEIEKECARLTEAAHAAREAGLVLHAGHGLDYTNYHTFRTAVPGLAEVSIGFAVVARALFVGFEQAVREMSSLVSARSI